MRAAEKRGAGTATSGRTSPPNRDIARPRRSLAMRTPLLSAMSILSVVALAASSPHAPIPEIRGGHAGKVLQSFDTMYGVDGPFVGDAFPIRGIPGDELPWEVREAKGKLDSDGHLTIRVRGLVFKDEPEVPPDLRGKNDESEFRD